MHTTTLPHRFPSLSNFLKLRYSSDLLHYYDDDASASAAANPTASSSSTAASSTAASSTGEAVIRCAAALAEAAAARAAVGAAVVVDVVSGFAAAGRLRNLCVAKLLQHVPAQEEAGRPEGEKWVRWMVTALERVLAAHPGHRINFDIGAINFNFSD